MSRSISYIVTFNNNKTKMIAGLFNPHGAEHFTSHFNGAEQTAFVKKITTFETGNLKSIKSRRLGFNASCCDSKKPHLGGIELLEYKFPAFRGTLDKVFQAVNEFRGNS